METENINQIDNYQKIKKISKIFLIISFLLIIYYLCISFINYDVGNLPASIANIFYLSFPLTIIVYILLIILFFSFYIFIAFLPYYITRKFYKFKNSNYKKQIKLGIITTIISFLIINMMLVLFSIPKSSKRYDPRVNGPIVPCTPVMIDGSLYYDC